MAREKNLALIFKAYPTGMPAAGEHLVVEDVGFDPSSPAPAGGFVAENLYASFEPYLRGRMRGPEVKSYIPAFKIGEPLDTLCIGRILKSDIPEYKEGDLFVAFLPIQQYSTIPAAVIPHIRLSKIPTAEQGGPKDLRDRLGALGGPGLTAYSSLYEIGKPKKGETIFVSSAAGAVGQIVGQLAKREGLKVIGSVGSDEKLKFIVDELGFDGGFNYKKEEPEEALKRLVPDGIDIYYDNVGGPTLDAALEVMKDDGRIIACGMISQYNTPPEEQYRVKNIIQILLKRLTMRGFLVATPEMMKYRDEFQKSVIQGLNNGSLKALTHEVVGMEQAPQGLVGIFKGENFGKAVLKIK